MRVENHQVGDGAWITTNSASVCDVEESLVAETNQASKGGGQRTRDHDSQRKGSSNVVGTLDPLNGKPPGQMDTSALKES